MRRLPWIFGVALIASGWASTGHAQVNSTGGGYSDPFFLYYSYFLPRQAAIAAQPNVNDTINAGIANRQSYAQTNRANLYDPNGRYGQFDNRFDATDAFGTGSASRSTRGSASSRLRSGSLPIPTTNINGQGPATHYNRGTLSYFRTLRPGQGPNRNLYVPGRGIRGGGGPVVGSPAPGIR